MKKRFVSLLLAVVISLGLLSAGAVPVSAESSFTTSDECIAVLKAEEGFVAYPMWDYAQYTVGYGTRCPDDKLDEYQANGITEAEAEALLRAHLNAVEAAINTKLIDAFQLNMTQNQFDALVMFSYNCGTGWLYNENDNLRRAITSGASDNEIIDRFSRWCNAGGQIKTYLLRRRLCEANMYLNGVYSKTAPDNYGYVLYDAAGGVTSTNVQGFNTDLTSVIIPIPTYDGYQFAGWYTAREGGNQVTVLDASVKNTRLYAHWVDSEGNTPNAGTVLDGTAVTLLYSDVNIRSGPGTEHEVVRTAHQGEQFTITETSNDGTRTWGKFTEGWISLEFTDYAAQVSGGGQNTDQDTEQDADQEKDSSGAVMGTVQVSDCLRVRSGPSTAYSVVAYLDNGARVEILEQQLVGYVTWAKIEAGWISMDYVVLDAQETAPQEPEATTPEETVPETTVPPAAEETVPPTTEATGPTETTTPSEDQEQTSSVLTGTVKVNDFLRVRTDPSTSSAIAGYLSPNERVEITETVTSGSTTWGKIAKGWISLDYVVLDSKESDDSTASQKVTGTTNVKQFLRIRSGPSTSYAIAGYLSPNEKVEILEQKTVGGTVWGRITKGWISLDYVILDNQTTQPETTVTTTKTVTADCLRIRSTAGTSAAIVGYLYSGAKVEILETTTVSGTVWGRTAKGWISLDYAV